MRYILKASCRARLHAANGLSPALSSCWRFLRSRRAPANASSFRARRCALSHRSNALRYASAASSCAQPGVRWVHS